MKLTELKVGVPQSCNHLSHALQLHAVYSKSFSKELAIMSATISIALLQHLRATLVLDVKIFTQNGRHLFKTQDIYSRRKTFTQDARHLLKTQNIYSKRKTLVKMEDIYSKRKTVTFKMKVIYSTRWKFTQNGRHSLLK